MKVAIAVVAAFLIGAVAGFSICQRQELSAAQTELNAQIASENLSELAGTDPHPASYARGYNACLNQEDSHE